MRCFAQRHFLCLWFVWISEGIIRSPNRKYTTRLPLHLFILSSCSAVGWVPLLEHVVHISVSTATWHYIKSFWMAPCRGFNTESELRTHICREHGSLIKRKCVTGKAHTPPHSERLPNTRGSILSPSVVTDSVHPLNTVSGALRVQTG